MTILSSPKGLTYKHFILTRFWFAKGPGGKMDSPADALPWLEGRLQLFQAYCLPSLVNQSCQDFTWLIYFDVLAPDAFVKKMQDIVAPYPNIEISTVKAWGVPTQVKSVTERTEGSTEVLEDIMRRLAGEAECILTTRLDSDDGLHRDFVQRLHDAVDEPKTEFFNFPNGILFYDNKSYLYHHPSNAFISLFEPVKTIKTVICGPHIFLSEVAPIRQLAPTPAFLQVVHGANDSNKPRGFRVPKIVGLQGFEAIKSLYDAPLEESNTDIVMNNLVWGSYWSGRDRILSELRKVRNAVRR